jgi:RNA polymerase sigma factor for flagellar operon FliA
MTTKRRPDDRSELTDALWQRYVTQRDAATRTQLLELYLGLVHHAAREIIPRAPAQLDLEDLISAGTVGLVQALEGFDPSRGLAFSSFAMPRIRGAILDELRSWDWVPRSVHQQNRRIEAARQRVALELGREPGAAEIARALGVDEATYRDCATRAKAPVLLTLDPDTRPTGETAALAETIADPEAENRLESLAASETVAQLLEAFANLSQRDRQVLTLSFYEKLSLKEIGEILHITQSRVCQIRSRALQRLADGIRIKEAA